MEGCNYCLKGKNFNTINYGDMSVKSYIEGNELNTVIHDQVWPDEDEGKTIKITHCPFCGTEVHDLPDEEMEEIEEEE